MTSPYLERPCRPLEEAKRQVGPRNWGIPPQPRVYTAEELSAIAEARKPDPLPLADRAIIIMLAFCLGTWGGLFFLLAYWR